VWLEHQRSATPLLEWEIDIAKLDIHNQIAHGTFGVVYRGTYDGRDVAGTILSILRVVSTGYGARHPQPDLFVN
jgi:hypothetical protein